MRHFIVVPTFDDAGPAWQGGTPAEQGYNVLSLPNLQRPNTKENEYHVYNNETEFKVIEADSVVSAVTASNIELPHKVVHANTRLGDVLPPNGLEYLGRTTSYMEKLGFSGVKDQAVLQAALPSEEVQPEQPA